MAYRHGYRRSEHREAVRGASLLDQEAPGWAARVDTERLPQEPVLSQVFGIGANDPHGAEGWVPNRLLETEEWAERFHELVYHGLIAGDEAVKRRLSIAWTRQVRERR